MTDFLTGLALVFVIEGLLYAVAPDAMRRLAQQAAQMAPGALRRYGLIAAAVGVGAVALLRG